MGDRTTAASPTPTDRLRQAKQPITVLAGPYGHPFHPMLVPVPIGAWIASFGFDIATRVSDEPDVFAKGAFWLVALGLVGALVAAMVGFVDLLGIPAGTRAFGTGLIHAGLNLVVVGLFTTSLLIRRSDIDDNPGETGIGLMVLSVVALGLLGVSGWLGGRMAFRFGVRVADENAQLDGYTDDEGAT